MDDLQPSDHLQQLWLSRQPHEEDVEMIVTRVLRDARKFQGRARRYDIAVVAAYLLLLPLCLLVVLYDLSELPLIAAGYTIWAVVLLSGLVAYRFFYRSVLGEPSPNGSSRDYIEHSIEYLNRRERFLMKSATPVSVLMAAAGIVFAFAAYRGQDALFQVVLSFLAQPLGLWATLDVQRRYDKKRSRLREILTDLDAN
jgi:TRAP-type uncharacterized transport system fused permease subunit